jgi:F0F1-type ATP synthase membrane subunit b/b'
MTTSEKLMDASQRLAKLSQRAKDAEDHAAAARNQAKADVEKSAANARAAAEAHVQELQKNAAAAGDQISASRNDMQESLANHMAQVRQHIDEKKGQLDAKHAESRADDAEADALYAIDYAYATVEEAEYAVLDAISVRMEANDLAMST